MTPTPFSQDPARVMHVVVISVFSFLALVAVIFRLWARAIPEPAWGTNDYLIVVGLVGVVPISKRNKLV